MGDSNKVAWYWTLVTFICGLLLGALHGWPTTSATARAITSESSTALSSPIPLPTKQLAEEFTFRGNVTHVAYDKYGMPTGDITLYGAVVASPYPENWASFHNIENIKSFHEELRSLESRVNLNTITSERRLGKYKVVNITMKVYNRGSEYYSERLEITKLSVH